MTMLADPPSPSSSAPRIESLAATQARWPTHRQLYTDFARHQRRKNLEQHTIYTRENALQRFAAYAAPKHLLEVTHEDINGWLDSCHGRKGEPLAPATRAVYITHLAVFYDWCVVEEKILRDPTRRVVRPRMPQRIPRPIQDEVLDNALRRIMEDGDARLVAMMTLMYLCGLRCVEVSRLQAEDVQSDKIRVLGKGNKERFVPLNEEAQDALRAYGVPRSGPLFTRKAGYGAGRLGLSAKSISTYVSQALPRGTTAHQLRHWFGTYFYDACKDGFLLADTMGHANMSTSKLYTKVDVSRAASFTANMGLRSRRT